MGQHLDKYLYYVLQVLVAIPYYAAAQQSKPVQSTDATTCDQHQYLNQVLVITVSGAVS